MTKTIQARTPGQTKTKIRAAKRNGSLTARDRAAVQEGRKLDEGGLLAYTKGSRFTDAQVREAIRRVLSGS